MASMRSWTLSLFFGVLLALNVFAAQAFARRLHEAKIDPAAFDNKPGRNIYPKPPTPTVPHEGNHGAALDAAEKVYPTASDEAKKLLHADSKKVDPATPKTTNGAH